MTVVDDLTTLDATAQAELVRRGECTPTELVDAAIGRIESLNPDVNAVIWTRADAARVEAANPVAGPFSGVPFLLKDLGGAAAGEPYHAGMRVLRDADWHAAVDSHVTTRARAAGFVICGRTNTPELGLAATTEPLAYGPTRNPWSPERSPGGSSGGSAAAVATGMVPAATASDGGGSIRIPASACGLVGLKSTRGRVSLGPAQGEGWGGASVAGVLTRSVRDTAAILDVLAGPMPGDPYVAPALARPLAEEVGADPGRLRIGLLTALPSGLAEVAPECAAAAEDAGRLLESLGHVVEPAWPDALDEQWDVEAHRAVVVASAIARAVDGWGEVLGRELGPDDVEPGTAFLLELGRALSASQYLTSLDWLHAWSRRFAAWWGDHDVLLSATTAAPTPPLGWLAQDAARILPLVAYTGVFNVSGQPAISVPLSSAGGAPLGVQLGATTNGEATLVRVAAQLEQARPWVDRRPGIGT